MDNDNQRFEDSVRKICFETIECCQSCGTEIERDGSPQARHDYYPHLCEQCGNQIRLAEKR